MCRLWLCLAVLLGLLTPARAAATGADKAPVRVGYYENELFL